MIIRVGVWGVPDLAAEGARSGVHGHGAGAPAASCVRGLGPRFSFSGVTDKEDKQDISEISDQIQIKLNLNLSKFKQKLYEKGKYFLIGTYG